MFIILDCKRINITTSWLIIIQVEVDFENLQKANN